MIQQLTKYPYRIVAAWVWLSLASIVWTNSLLVTFFSSTLLFALLSLRFKKLRAEIRKTRLPVTATLIGVLVLVCSGFTFLGLSELAVSKDAYKRVELTGTILDQPKQLANGTEYAVAVSARSIDSKKVNDFWLQFRGLPRGMLIASSDGITQIKQGDDFSAFGVLVPTNGPNTSQRSSFTLKAESLTLNHQEFGSWLTAAREGFAALVSPGHPSGAPLVLGLTTGDTSLIPKHLLDQMKSVGLTHLVAVSGANCAIVMAAILVPLAQTRIRRANRVLLGTLALVGYVLLVGFQPSVLRASVMLGFVFIANAMGRKVHPLDAISLAILLLLLVDPWLAAEAGFGLSVLATVALLSLAPAIALRLEAKLPIWLSLPVALVLATQILCLPILVSLGSKVGVAAIFANLIAAPLVAPITILGMAAFLLSLFSSPLAAWLFSLAAYLATPIVGIAESLSKPELTGFVWLDGPLGIALAISISLCITVWLLTHRRKLRKAAVVLVSIAVAALAASLLSRSPFVSGRLLPDWSVFSCNVGQGDAYVLRSANQTALVDVGPDPDAIDDCLMALGITRIDLLVLTHFDHDHVGGLDGALRKREVSTALTTTFKDPRPAAAVISQRIQVAASQVMQPRAGNRGLFGNGSYLVLNPGDPNAFYEDANDASISLVFWFDGLQVLMLADLGETGQMRIAPMLLSSIQSQRCTILKVAHHGSANFYQELYQELDYDLAMISVGDKNGYGHPTERALSTLERANVNVARTDKNGWIAARCRNEFADDGNRLVVTVQR